MKKLLYILLVFVLFIIYAISQDETQKPEKEKIEVKEGIKKPKRNSVKSRLIQTSKIQATSIVDGFKTRVIIDGKSVAIKSKDYEDVYFVAIEISKYYQALKQTQKIGVGVWALGGSGGSCYSVNDIAIENSFYPNVNVSMYDDGALEVKKHISSGKGFKIPQLWIDELKEEQERQRKEVEENKRILREKGINI
jgi:hypothetical protein